jgi:replicative DNA helicase
MIEQQILNGIVFDEEFARTVMPFLKSEYFREDAQNVVFGLIQSYVEKYNKRPTPMALAVELTNLNNLPQSTFDQAKEVLKSMKRDEVDRQWLTDQTEQFCQDKAIVNAVMEAIKIIDDKNGSVSRGAIPKLLQDAISVCFDDRVGHDYFDGAAERWEFYHRLEERVDFDLEWLNKVTGGGVPKKTLNIILGGTNTGKTLLMTHMASANLKKGKNVLYITMEMAEERISERIDANLMDVSVDELKRMPKDVYLSKMDHIRSTTVGKLIVKEFPTSSAGAAHFRHLLNELRIKKNFVPDIIYIDYLNICVSTRIKANSGANSYTIIKSIAEELRGLAVEFNVPVISATQTTRSGYDSSDVDLTDTSESFGLPATADFMFAIMRTEELDQINQMLFKQLKNRYSDVTINVRAVIGVDRPKFRFYDVESSAQRDVMNTERATSMQQSSTMSVASFKRTTTKPAEFDFT